MRALTLVAMLGLLVGCGAAGEMMPLDLDPDASAPLPDAGGTDTAGQKPDTGGADRAPDRMADTQAPDTRREAFGCNNHVGFGARACGRVVPGMCGGYGWSPQWKDGWQCGVCDQDNTPVTGCTVGDRGKDECDKPLERILCVSSCSECCYADPGGPCSSNADCCAPLSCVEIVPGGNKHCQ